MASADVTTDRGDRAGATDLGNRNVAQRLTTETKSFFKTSEFWTYIMVVIGILIAGNAIEGQGGPDIFSADKVWLYITILTVGYLLSRGIAKAGSRDPYWSERGDRNADH
jgi:hypothetical protein